VLGEHRELHAIWTVLTEGKTGYSRHPETLRWVGKTKALYARHEVLVKEMQRRGYNHRSPLDRQKAKGSAQQSTYVDTPKRQRELLAAKECDCLL
jgi:hypothetical protein